MHGSGGSDSFDQVKDFMDGLGGRLPRRDEIDEIAPALHEVYRRLMRVRAFSPAVDLSEGVWSLMELAGIRTRPGRSRIPFGRAAML